MAENEKKKAKPVAYLVRLQPHHAERLAGRARQAGLSPNQYIKDRMINVLDGRDPAEYRDLTRELAELRGEVNADRAERAEFEVKIEKYLRRVDWILQQIRVKGGAIEE